MERGRPFSLMPTPQSQSPGCAIIYVWIATTMIVWIATTMIVCHAANTFLLQRRMHGTSKTHAYFVSWRKWHCETWKSATMIVWIVSTLPLVRLPIKRLPYLPCTHQSDVSYMHFLCRGVSGIVKLGMLMDCCYLPSSAMALNLRSK